MSTRIALAAAIVLGIVAAFAVKTTIAKKKEDLQRPYRPIEIVVARTNIAKGQPLTAKQMESWLVPKKLAVNGMIDWSQRRYYVSQVTTKNLEKGEMILKSSLRARGTRGGARVESMMIVKENMRAVTIRADQMNSQGYLLQPGNYVDVAGTFQITSKSTGGASRSANKRQTETRLLWEAVKVVAIDNLTKTAFNRLNRVKRYSTITLEMTPGDAIRLLDAEARGKIYLLLRSGNDTKTPLASEVKSGAPFSAVPQ